MNVAEESERATEDEDTEELHRESVSEQISKALEVHTQKLQEMEKALEEGRAYQEELEENARQAELKVAEVEESAAAVEAQKKSLGEELADWRTKASIAEGLVLRHESGEVHTELLAELEELRAKVGGGNSGSDEKIKALEAELFERRRVEEQLTSEAEEVGTLRERIAELEEKLSSAASESPRGFDQVESNLSTATSLLDHLENGLTEIRERSAEQGEEKAPSAWATQREQALSQMASELGMKDAEITLLNAGVAALQKRLEELEKRLGSD